MLRTLFIAMAAFPASTRYCGKLISIEAKILTKTSLSTDSIKAIKSSSAVNSLAIVPLYFNVVMYER
jgi:hypothetical protein